ncbi:TPA: hypothetical protein KOC08_003652 [Clostridioides difficile]|uniref:hypothetical protein n=1 Tax=Clostridioides difficile TaxID=1496 RepID=UPI0010BA30A1|nr:hypothetical protein [Clostridioides difficile]MDC9294411.1 hypothetical protein [Clostridioides difficile]MDC9476461.1 hypothetical protein [Clostridioides difficile]VII06504.1 Uncharacterised protein [Clostridioides difficile]HAU5327102.1 hypothetical protein [Clostridioides difficile]HBF3473821.1 hypothetical protein [Clostridioides difficile]
MRESLLNEYNLKTDKDIEYFVKFANALYELKQNSEEKFQEYVKILREILIEQQENENILDNILKILTFIDVFTESM